MITLADAGVDNGCIIEVSQRSSSGPRFNQRALRPVRVVINNRGENDIVFENIEQDTPISVLKERIQAQTGIPAEKIFLYNGRSKVGNSELLSNFNNSLPIGD